MVRTSQVTCLTLTRTSPRSGISTKRPNCSNGSPFSRAVRLPQGRLAALAKCDGIADWLLLPNVEPGNDEVIAAFREWDACEMRLVVNEKRLGLNRNTHDAVFRAFKLRADVTLHLEDDTVPSPDALRYFDWAVRELLIPDVKSPDGCQILLASGYNKPKT